MPIISTLQYKTAVNLGGLRAGAAAMIDRASFAADAVQAKIGGIGATIAGAFAIYKGFDFLRDGIKGATDLNETISKTDAVLGSASGAVKAFADEMNSKFGFVKADTLDLASGIGGLAKGLGGLRGEKLAGVTTNLTKLAADLSSFKNIDLKTAGEALRIGLSGEQSDQLKALGVVMTEDAVKAQAYASGIARVGEKLSESQKFAARSALITKGLADAQGDLERTGGGAANQGRKLQGILTTIGTEIGAVLLPVLTEGMILLNEFGASILSSFQTNKSAIEGWKETFLGAFDYVVATIHNFPAALEVVRLKAIEKLINIGEYFAVLGPNAIMVAKYIGRNWLLLIGDAFDATITGLKNLWSNFQAVGTAIGEWFADPTQGFHVNWTPLLDGFKATAEKFPALIRPVLTDLSKEIAAAAKPIGDEVAARVAKRALAQPASAVADAAVDATKTPVAKKKGHEKQFGAALELGSKEAYSAIINATAGRSKNESADKTAANTSELVKLEREKSRKATANGKDRQPARLVIA
jgi:hypothetical protein